MQKEGGISPHHLYGSSRLGIWQANRYLTVGQVQTPECSYDLPYGYDPYADPDSADICACAPCDQGCEEAYDIALAQYCQGDPNCELPPDWCAYNELTPDPCGCPPCIDVILDPETGAVVSSTPCDPCPCANWPVEPEFVLDGSESPHEKRHLTRGRKRYEGSNHLGNVLVVFSDRKLPLNSGSTVTGYQADVHAHSDYYPFGSVMEERTGSAEGYRFGFNGKESDNEVYGTGNVYDYGFRVYNPRLGRFLSQDPLSSFFPFYSPYQFAGNKPIWAIDLEGLQEHKISAEEYYKYSPRIDMTDASGTRTNAAGHPRNGPWFWRKMLERYPEYFSESNKATIRAGRAPTVDQTWIDANPSHSHHAEYMGDRLIHHHVDQGAEAVGIPEKVHRSRFSDLHTENPGGRRSQKSGRGSSIRGGSGLNRALGITGFILDFNVFSPHSLVRQVEGALFPSVERVYYNSDSDTYYEYQEISEDGRKFTIYRDVRWSSDQERLVGEGYVGEITLDKDGNGTFRDSDGNIYGISSDGSVSKYE